MKAVWIVDDDRSIRWVLEKALAKARVPVRTFERPQDAIAALASDSPAVVMSDIRMNEMSGLELLSHMKAALPGVPVIIMTAYSDLDSAVSAFQGGAYEYLAKPFDINRAVELLQRALEESRGGEQAAGAAPPPDKAAGQEAPSLIGHSKAMQEVFRAIGRLSQSSVTVLLTGESGSGKEVVARALHRHSIRSGAPFVAINTAAIPRELLESELFGHERGAFTGASSLQHGRFEQARGGTLFLDEIGDMPMELQTRLLRVLSEGCFYRVGGHVSIRSDARIIAATNQNLEQRVKDGLFREDLYHRLNVIRLRLPPLRERPEDIPALAEHFLEMAARSLSAERKILSDEALARMTGFGFPGNVRQLENLCNWLTVMAPAQVIREGDLPEELRGGQASFASGVASPAGAAAACGWEESLCREAQAMLEAGAPRIMPELTRRFETAVIRTALAHTRGRKVEAAQKLAIGRNTLTRKLQEYFGEEA
ncbi:MAG: nitrogen regulation protein NR(I) [Duodenibacillus sp.]|nr:nitrogen regulation protein NR(I) [Duodenibacillus sp.]